MKVTITVHEKDLVYTGVTQVETTKDHVVLILKDDYTVSDESFSSEHNISVVPFRHHFVDCSNIFVVDN